MKNCLEGEKKNRFYELSGFDQSFSKMNKCFDVHPSKMATMHPFYILVRLRLLVGMILLLGEPLRYRIGIRASLLFWPVLL